MAEKLTKKEKLSAKGITKGLIKSAVTVDGPQLLRNFWKRPTVSTIKAALIGTGLAGTEGAAKEIYNQIKDRKGDAAKILSETVNNILKRGSRGYVGVRNVGSKVINFGKKIKEGINFNEGGMATARKEGMGLQYKMGGGYMKKKSPMATYKKGGSVKSSSKKSRGTGAAIKGTKFKGVF